jgi:glycosyltransferase involved in cell wall biosynthesis
MKLLTLFNEYRATFGGEYKVIADLAKLYEQHQIEALLVTRSSKDLDFADKCRAFVHGIYSIPAKRDMVELLEAERPDLVHAHNLYPFFSPSVLVACREARVPVVMTLHNYGLTCPHWSHFLRGSVCERCFHGSEVWAVLKNCQDNLIESTGYALRCAFARKRRLFHHNVTTFISLSSFAKHRMVEAGFDFDRIAVLPNFVDIPEGRADVARGRYVGFAGRLSPEKGVETLLDAARMSPDISFRLAGDGPLMQQLRSQAPPNVEFLGLIGRQELCRFYEGARILVVPSTCFEMCPTTILEGMAAGLPVIASRLGGMPELVDENTTGLLFEPGNPEDLARTVGGLWKSPETCQRMGSAGRERAVLEFNQEDYFNHLMAIYDEAMHRSQTSD